MASLKSSIVIFSLLGSATLPAISVLAAEVDAFDHGEIPDPDAIRAYQRFWDAFQDYEQQKKQASVEEYQRARDGLESIYAGKEKSAMEKRVAILDEAIKRYNVNLEKTPNATNRPYVLLTLAQMYAELASLQKSAGNDSAKTTRQSALNILKALEENHKGFTYNTDALYLRATLLEANGEPRTAVEIWRKLASTGNDRFTLHGNIASGDYEFESASPDKAIKYYERARGVLAALDDGDKGLDELRIYYRLAWANFKAGRHAEAISAARHVIAPGVLSKSVRQKERIAHDIAELTGYALYENDSDTKTRDVITSKDYQVFGAAIALVVIEQYITANLPSKAAAVGELAATSFPLAREYPDILRSKAKAEDLLGKKGSRLETLEKLSMLLPRQSLWRNRHQDENDVVRYMEGLAKSAAESVAATYYEDGLASGNPKKFNMAATHYSILLDEQLNSDAAPGLRLKIANCQFFAGNLTEANKRYAELITTLKTPEDILTTAHFQRVLTLEKIWRGNYEAAVQRRLDPMTDRLTLDALAHLAEAVDEHANKFPGQSRSVDLLLVAASANRDHNRLEEASRFWQRALLSSPSAGQRAISIRGLVFVKLRAGKPADVIESVSKFIKLEKADALSQNLQTELLGVLTSASIEEANKLSKAGAADEAGRLLLKTSADFKNIPNREQLWRDGAYFVAISGNWNTAQLSAENYLKEGNKKYAGDMTYLLARSNEYQLRFNESVNQYLSLGEHYPNHPRSLASLERAEKLAVAEENFTGAAKAARIRADRGINSRDKLAGYDAAISYMLLGGQNANAMAMAEQRKSASKTTTEKLEAELGIANVRYQTGDKQSAVDDLDTIAKQIERAKFTLGDSYRRLAADANFRLGEHAYAIFSEKRIDDSKGDTASQVDSKSKVFSELVTRMDKVASLDQPDLSPKARFTIAQAASALADEINGIPARTGEPVTLKSQSRFNQNITRLRDMANRYHGNNILAKQRSPQAYAKNEWIGKSALALSSTTGGQESANGKPQSPDQLSTGASTEMPEQWSH